jgi:ribosomal protein S18 acetylase RimI-like enzyme
MVAYRFCRPDDIPRLVDAVNSCFTVHFAGAAELTVDEFRREMRELQLWPSNCMIANAGDTPAAVILGTKRPHEVMVRRLGVAPGFQRQGLGRHLVGSLSQKLAVLGPPRLLAEVPGDNELACAFFSGVGWREEARLVDWERPEAPPGPPPPAAAFVQLGVRDLAPELLAGGVAWAQQPESLRELTDLRGLALSDGETVAAWALHRRTPQATEVFAWGGGTPGEPASDRALELLASRLQHDAPGALRVRWAPAAAAALLGRIGFAPVATTVRFATVAQPL